MRSIFYRYFYTTSNFLLTGMTVTEQNAHLLLLRNLYVDVSEATISLLVCWNETSGLLLLCHCADKIEKVLYRRVGCLDVNYQSGATEPKRLRQLGSTLHKFAVVNAHSCRVEEYLGDVVRACAMSYWDNQNIPCKFPRRW